MNENAHNKELIDKAIEYIKFTNSSSEKEYIKRLMQKNKFKKLKKLFDKDLVCKRSKIKTKIGIGTNCVNNYTVNKIALAIKKFNSYLDYLIQRQHPKVHDVYGIKAYSIAVFIGYDNNEIIKSIVDILAETFTAIGYKIYAAKEPVTSPFTAWMSSTRQIKTGIMISYCSDTKKCRFFFYLEDGCFFTKTYSKIISDYIKEVKYHKTDGKVIIQEYDHESALKNYVTNFISSGLQAIKIFKYTAQIKMQNTMILNCQYKPAEKLIYKAIEIYEFQGMFQNYEPHKFKNMNHNINYDKEIEDVMDVDVIKFAEEYKINIVIIVSSFGHKLRIALKFESKWILLTDQDVVILVLLMSRIAFEPGEFLILDNYNASNVGAALSFYCRYRYCKNSVLEDDISNNFCEFVRHDRQVRHIFGYNGKFEYYMGTFKVPSALLLVIWLGCFLQYHKPVNLLCVSRACVGLFEYRQIRYIDKDLDVIEKACTKLNIDYTRRKKYMRVYYSISISIIFIKRKNHLKARLYFDRIINVPVNEIITKIEELFMLVKQSK